LVWLIFEGRWKVRIMESKYPKVKNDWERLSRLPYFTSYEIVEFLFGLECDFLKTPPGQHEDQYHIQASLIHWKLWDWILRDMQTGILNEIPAMDSQNTCFAASEIKKWLIDRKIIHWLVDQGIRVPVDTMKYFNFETPVGFSDPQNKMNAHPAPTTELSKRKPLKSKAFAIYKKLKVKGERFIFNDILNHPDWADALEDSGYKRKYKLPPKTMKNWLTEFRKSENPTDSEK
jgi:hypothetical protein